MAELLLDVIIDEWSIEKDKKGSKLCFKTFFDERLEVSGTNVIFR